MIMIRQESNLKETDKRMFERMSCDFQVEANVPAAYFTEKARSCDFSAGGVCLLSGRPFPFDRMLELKIYFSKYSNPVIRKARVIWEKRQVSGMWRIGLKFSDFNPAKLIRLMPS